jgi:hypothetical protein
MLQQQQVLVRPGVCGDGSFCAGPACGVYTLLFLNSARSVALGLLSARALDRELTGTVLCTAFGALQDVCSVAGVFSGRPDILLGWYGRCFGFMLFRAAAADLRLLLWVHAALMHCGAMCCVGPPAPPTVCCVPL